MKKLFLLAFAAFALAACSDDNNGPAPKPEYDVISFETSEHLLDAGSGADVALGAVTMSIFGIGDYTYSPVFCAKAYATAADFDGMLFSTADQKVAFNSYYAKSFDTWGGIALAQSADRTAAVASLKQQFSVWADGGADDTQTYAVCYDSNTPTEAYPEYMSESGYPTVDFTEPRVVDHLSIANSTYVYNYFKGDAEDLFQVKITGWNGTQQAGSITETLVSGASKLSDWRKVDLSSFGAVDKLVFKVTGVDVTTDPTYFCLDGITLVK